SGDAMQVIVTIQSTAIRTDLLTVDSMGLPFTQSVVNRACDEDMGVKLLQAVIVICIPVVQTVGILWYCQSTLDVPCVNGAFGHFSNHFLSDSFREQFHQVGS